MRKIPFDIRYRQEIQSGEFSVVTRDDRPVTILRWDMKGNYPILACTMVKQCNWEGDESWDEERPFLSMIRKAMPPVLLLRISLNFISSYLMPR